MTLLLLNVFIVAVSALPTPNKNNGSVEMIVNDVVEPLENRDVLDVKLNKMTNGDVLATDLLHPFTATGIADVAEVNNPESLSAPVVKVEKPHSRNLSKPDSLEVDTHDSVILPSPLQSPEVVSPETVVPETIVPDAVVCDTLVPDTIVSDTVVPDTIVPDTVVPDSVDPKDIMTRSAPEIDELAEEVPSPAAQDSEFYNDGVVSVAVNDSEDSGMLSTLQSWFNMVVNYFNDDGIQTS